MHTTQVIALILSAVAGGAWGINGALRGWSLLRTCLTGIPIYLACGVFTYLVS